MKTTLSTLLATVIFLFSCKKDKEPAIVLPTVTTAQVSATTTNGAISGGVISSQGSAAVTARGVVWATAANPTIDLTTKTSDGTGLQANTTYHIRAYASSSEGTAYGNDVEFTTASPKLYVCGTEWNSAEAMQRAKLWVNGTGTFLGDNIESFAQSMTVTDAGDVYVAGSVKSSNWRAVYWKNGTVNYITITNGSTYAVANAISVVGSDVYTAGYETNASGKLVAKYWKNGTAFSLSDGTQNADARAIYINGSDVHVAGYEYDAMGIMYPVYWKNGIKNTSVVGEGIAQSIYVTGNNTYIAGGMNGGTFAAGAVYWLNGNLNYLTPNNSTKGFAKTVFVLGSDVYMGGYDELGFAAYWKNGTKVGLNSNNLVNSMANSIFVAGNDVYVAGKLGSNVSCYWKNGIKSDLSTNAYSYNNATGIVYK